MDLSHLILAPCVETAGVILPQNIVPIQIPPCATDITATAAICITVAACVCVICTAVAICIKITHDARLKEQKLNYQFEKDKREAETKARHLDNEREDMWRKTRRTWELEDRHAGNKEK